MKKRLTFPMLWVLLTAMWLLLYQSAAPAHWLLGALVAYVAVSVYALLQPPIRLLHRAGALAELLAIWAFDIVRSNIGVARIVIRLRSYRYTTAFLDIPLRTRNPAALAVLACIITSNPGTVWGRYDAEANVLTMHILDLIDEDEWLRIIQDRYERRLLEIFG
jgi:multicomponent K+:H+ antiporter subunit E